MRLLSLAALVLVAAAMPASAAGSLSAKQGNSACGKSPRTVFCANRGFDAKPLNDTPVPFVLGSGKKSG
jgi:hypothetical protein